MDGKKMLLLGDLGVPLANSGKAEKCWLVSNRTFIKDRMPGDITTLNQILTRQAVITNRHCNSIKIQSNCQKRNITTPPTSLSTITICSPPLPLLLLLLLLLLQF